MFGMGNVGIPNFVCRLTMVTTSQVMVNYSQWDVVSHVTPLNLGTLCISVTFEAWHFKFVTY